MPYYDDPMLKALESLGVGASDTTSETLQKTSIQTVKANLEQLAKFDKWQAGRNEESNGLAIMEWTAGGFSVSGYQKISIVLRQLGENVDIRVASKSKGGQIADWGANKNNVVRILAYLKNPSAGLTIRHVSGEKRGYIFMFITIVLAILIFTVYIFILGK